MSIRTFFGGLLVIAGLATTTLFATAMILSMRLDAGDGLVIGLSGLGGGVAALIGGAAVLLYQR